jgi:acetyl-CoA C-acetyltransferase
MSDIVFVGAKRTPIGSFSGAFTGVPSPVLGSNAIRAAIAHAGISADKVDEVLMGCVLPGKHQRGKLHSALVFPKAPAVRR